jgi:alkylhydroperoxidase family enzyme
MELLSASPAYLERQMDNIAYYRSHKKLTPPLLAAIRYLAAENCGHAFCTVFNGGILKKMGLTDQDLAQLRADPQNANLEENEATMLAFVKKTLEAPESVTSADIEALRGQGYEDSDIFDAVGQAAGMIAGAVFYKAFARD